MKNKQNSLFKLILFSLAVLSLSSCETDPVTLALHNPIYPNAGESVTYSIEKATTGTISSARLYERVRRINSSGVVTSSGTETLIKSWTSPTGNLSHIKSGGYPENSLVTYRFEITTPETTKKYNITYATRPYPVSNFPAPIYCQGDPDDVLDVIFIPDTDITNLNTFYSNCRGAIRESYFDEKTTRLWRKQFNFYINPIRGTATHADRISTDGHHQKPSNWGNLSFAEGKVLMHQNNLRDYSWSGIFSTEMQNRGTILHESGHGLFGLADEYASGAHWESSKNPNNWSSNANCTTASTNYGNCKSASDCVQMGTSGFYKLCQNDCQMLTTGLTHTEYDCPDVSRINLVVIETATSPSP